MTVVYLHAVGLDGALWTDVARPGALTPDLPGHGGAPRPAGPLTMAALVEHVADLIEEHGGGPADLVGISLGSMVAQQVAVHRPELVRSMVLACGGMRTDPAVSAQRSADTRLLGVTGTLDVTLRRWFTAAALADPDHPGVAWARARLLADDADVVADYWAAMAGHDLTGALGAVTVPTTCIGATADASVPVAAMRAVADAIPGGRMREIPGPHIVVLEEPAGFVAAVDEHLAWVDTQVGVR
ncbi:alpha/beta fold hydrolase [Pseudonocardia sp. GCM10023141]|uniref:alpha/beta fold hydrolase n=1 Tax=Pseudonocardia sp. GCM10023141 TaxID=3252653 RepID=UPI00360E8BCD